MPDAEVIEAEEVTEETEEEVRQLPAVRAHEAVVARDEISVDDLLAQRTKIVDAMDRAMRQDVHYGVIPGTQKPTLLKPGAELLNSLFRLAPSYQSDKTWHDDGHLTVISNCTLTHIPTGLVLAGGEGLCSTRESKYAYRQGKRTCPSCGADAIVRSGRKNAYFCISAEGGCGNRYAFGTEQAKTLDEQDTSRVENPDLPDQFNTVVKMANKRALIAAVLNGTAASDVFTQDAEDSAPGPAATGSGSTGAERSAAPVMGAEHVSRENAARDFDPGKDLLEGAVTADGDYVHELNERMKHIEPSLDWGAVIKQAWTAERTSEFWVRLSNCVEWIYKTAGMDKGDFPPAEEQHIVAGFAWAFDGVVVELVWKEPREAPIHTGSTEITEDIGFGD